MAEPSVCRDSGAHPSLKDCINEVWEEVQPGGAVKDHPRALAAQAPGMGAMAMDGGEQVLQDQCRRPRLPGNMQVSARIQARSGHCSLSLGIRHQYNDWCHNRFPQSCTMI